MQRVDLPPEAAKVVEGENPNRRDGKRTDTHLLFSFVLCFLNRCHSLFVIFTATQNDRQVKITPISKAASISAHRLWIESVQCADGANAEFRMQNVELNNYHF